MPVYNISLNRLRLEYQHNLKGKSAGTLNWYVYSKNSKLILKILIDINNITYVYQQIVVDKDSIPSDVALMLDHNKSIIGGTENTEKKFNVQFASPLPGEEQ